MNFRFTVVETALNRAEFRWKWLRFLQHSFLLGSILCLTLLLVGLGMVLGLISTRSLATTFYALAAVIAFVAWAIIIIGVAAGSPDRNWLAAAIERVDLRLLDRLNTLLFLEARRRDPGSQAFAVRIARQAQRIFSERASPAPFRGDHWRVFFLTFLLLAIGTIVFYRVYAPWQRVLAAEQVARKLADHPAPAKPTDLNLPATNNVEQSRPWGEVRITDPGTDLRVTKVDVIPLQIEAAANQTLKQVGWFGTVNGGDEVAHELPAPTEPRYAVYNPTIYLDELRLSDWDVMTYYARAKTEGRNSYASQVYFLEVRPFREDILKMPGGEGGKPYQAINEISSLINRQQHVIRETHQHLQSPPEQEKLAAQDRKKLADAESDLGESARHLYAKLATEMENKPIGQALDNLAKAEKSLDHASRLLADNIMNEAQNRERAALSDLVATRKMFQKAMTDDPKAFQDQDPTAEPPPPVAENSRKLNEMAEFRNESKAAQDFVHKTLQQQKKIEQDARSRPRSEYQQLASQERQLQQGLHDFQEQHPQVFKGADTESRKAQEAMAKAGDALQRRANDAASATRQATQQLEQLSQTMQNSSIDRQLANAYKLKQLLDGQTKTFDERSKPDSKISDEQLQKTVEEARETVSQLKKTAEQEPTRDAFGQPLRDALSGQNRVDIESKLQRLEKPRTLQDAREAGTKEQRAGEARDALANVSKAFEQSQPKAMQMARKNDSLKDGAPDGMNQGMAELDSLIQQMQKGGQMSPEDAKKQGRQALYNLQTGMRSFYGDNEAGNQIMLRLDKMLNGEEPLDIGDLKQLLEQLQHFSLEAASRVERSEDKPQVANIDPARLPPAYRGRIQKYFQKLSDQR
jgi:hypothetical protein